MPYDVQRKTNRFKSLLHLYTGAKIPNKRKSQSLFPYIQLFTVTIYPQNHGSMVLSISRKEQNFNEEKHFNAESSPEVAGFRYSPTVTSFWDISISLLLV